MLLKNNHLEVVIKRISATIVPICDSKGNSNMVMYISFNRSAWYGAIVASRGQYRL